MHNLRRKARIIDVLVEWEHALALKMELELVSSLADQEDDDEEDYSNASKKRRVRAKWAEDLVNEDHKRVECPNIKKQTERYTGYMALMTKVVDSQSMVGKNKSSKRVLQNKVGKPSSLVGATATMKNTVMLNTHPSG